MVDNISLIYWDINSLGNGFSQITSHHYILCDKFISAVCHLIADLKSCWEAPISKQIAEPSTEISKLSNMMGGCVERLGGGPGPVEVGILLTNG